MKILIVFSFILGLCMAAACDEKDFFDGTDCIACDKSPCKTCQGTEICEECPTNAKSSERGMCDKCNPGSLLVDKVCVACDSELLKALPDEGDGECCICTEGDTACCPATSGVYRGTDKCFTCSSQILGCTRCTVGANSVVTCSECGTDFDLDSTVSPPKCVWNSATHLLAVGGLLISLLILV